MILAQSRFERLESLLYWGRWVPLGLLAVYTVGKRVLAPRPRGPMIRQGEGVDAWILGWIALAYVSAVYSIAPQTTIQLATTLLLGYGAVFWGVWHYANRYGEERVVTLILTCASLVVVASWVGLFGGVSVVAGPENGGGEGIRFRGVMENPNSLGMLCAFTIPLFLYSVLRERSALWYGLFGLVVVAMLFTGNRGSIGASIIGCAYLLWKAKSINRKTALIFLAMATGLGLYALQGTVEEIILRSDQIETASGRSGLWGLFEGYIQNRPLLGHGWGTEDLLHAYYGIDLNRLRLRGAYAGNSYIGFVAQMGILGATAFFLPLLWTMGRAALVPKGILLRFQAFNAVLIVGLITAVVESWMSSLGNAQSLLFWIPVMLLIRRQVRAKRARHIHRIRRKMR